ncbi:MAG: dephospho-CoA kinase [Parachlamydiales bacterium]|nr:dephospho-CoA kinase [Parachlamydiales bacterium]
MLKVAIVGNMLCGKSESLKIFKSLKCYTLSADDITKKILQKNSEIINQVIDLLGKKILTDNKIDRKKVADIVFKNEKILKQYEQILHPEIIKEIFEIYEKVKNKDSKNLFVVEMPLLFEIGAEKLFDVVICISRKDKIEKKDDFYKDYVLRIKRQLPQKEIEQLSDFVIDNNQDLISLKENIIKLSKKIKKNL